MKRLLLFNFLLLFSVLFSSAQKIEKDYYDQFTGERVMFTKLEKVNWNYKNDRIGGKMQLRFVLNDDYQYMVLHWYTKKFLRIEEDAMIQIKLDNGHLINLTNEKSVESSVGGTGIDKNQIGVVLNCLGEVDKFASAQVVAIRIYTSDGYYDFDINRKDAIKIHRQYLLFNKQTNLNSAY